MKTRYLDIEPDWNDIIPMYCDWLETGTKFQKELARKEFIKIGKVASHYRKKQKEEIK
tara:strand:- start:547 stop:720 length:174 start_codon:yes stop_codon:yes gene_type:complete